MSAMTQIRELGGVNNAAVPPYDRILAAILDGSMPAGSELKELAIAEWCGVSRTPVREALSRLEQDGLVARGRRGFVVRTRSFEEIEGLYAVRILLEAGAARFAAERRTTVDLHRLGYLCDQAETTVDAANPDELVASNSAFHSAVWAAAHNGPLAEELERVQLKLTRYTSTTLSSPGRWPKALGEHRAMLAAIENRDGDTAAGLAEAHFNSSRDIRLALWAELHG